MALLRTATFNLSMGRQTPCHKENVERSFSAHVICPRAIDLKYSIKVDGVYNKEHRSRVKIDTRAVCTELENMVKAGVMPYEGKKLYHGLLVIKEKTANYITIEANPEFSPFPRNRDISSIENILNNVNALVGGSQSEWIKDLVEGDIKTCISRLSEDHPEEVKAAICNRQFEPILARQDGNSLARILFTLISGMHKLGQLYQSQEISDLYHFLPAEALSQITKLLSSRGIFVVGKYCQQIHKVLERLDDPGQAALRAIVADARSQIIKKLTAARDMIEEDLGIEPDHFYIEPTREKDEVKLHKTVLRLYQQGLFQLLLPAHLNEIATTASENARAKWLRRIEGSDMVDNAKQLLLSILAEKEFVYVSMYSFTSPLFAAALLATMLRGARIKVFMDKEQSTQANSQYDAFISHAQELRHKFEGLPSFEYRQYSDTMHQKNFIFGSGKFTTGSQNVSGRGLIRNVEDLFLVEYDAVNFRKKKQEFEALYGFSGRFVPFPEDIAAQHWLKRSGLTGIRFLDRIPLAGEVEQIMQGFRISPADYKRAHEIQELARGKGFVIEKDYLPVFSPFLVNMDPLILRFLIRFMQKVPLGFGLAPASLSGKYHPGTTAGLSGLPEHVLAGCKMVSILCKILGRPDLIDKATAAFIAHDTYKDAHRDAGGNIDWGAYNHEHGALAAEKWKEVIESFPPAERNKLKELLKDADIAIAQHMGEFQPVPTPLLPTDPIEKFIVLFADDLVSKKYIYVEHPARQQREMEEILHVMLNNSYITEGEGLSSLGKDAEIFNFIKALTAPLGYQINEYQDLPRRAKKMLRIAESLCDRYAAYREVIPKKGEELTEEQKARIENRNEILGATLLYAILRYHHGIHEPASKKLFHSKLKEFAEAYPNQDTRLGKTIKLLQEADKTLITSARANLKPESDPELTIICLANCLMTSRELQIFVDDDVEQGLAKAEEPKTVWVKAEYSHQTEARLIADIEKLVFEKYLPEFQATISEGLLARLNFRKKKPLEAIHPDIVAALIKKFGSIAPFFIYEQYYKPLSDHFRGKLVERLREANSSEDAKNELIAAINKLPKPEKEPPRQIFKMMAQTALAKGIETIDQLDKFIQEARNVESMYDYSRFPQMKPAVGHIIEKLKSPEEVIRVWTDYDMDGMASAAILEKTLRLIKIEFLSARSARETARLVIKTMRPEMTDNLPPEIEKWISTKYPDQTVGTIEMNRIAKETVEWFKENHLAALESPKEALKISQATITWFREIHLANIKAEAQKIADRTILPYIPNRLKEGYGLNKEGLESCKIHGGCGTVITADCGTNDGDKIKWASEQLGISFIITDHHTPDKEKLPQNAVALINPKLDLQDTDPAYFLPGAAVAFKLCWALLDEAGIKLKRDSFTDTVMMATKGDLVSNRGENRVFMREGLKRINTPGRNRGLGAIIRAKHLERIDDQAVSFGLVPVPNATGRMGQQEIGYNILMARSEKEAAPDVAKAIKLLEQRREIQKDIFKKAEEMIGQNPESGSGIALAGEFHAGVIGLVAAQLAEKYGVPATLIATAAESLYHPEEPAYGSVRSGNIANAYDILQRCNELSCQLFASFGGHSGAAGLKIFESKIALFQKIYHEVTKMGLKDPGNQIIYVGKLGQEDLSVEEIEIMKGFLGPFGPDFEEPRYLVEARIKHWQVFGGEQQHIRGELENSTSFVFFFGNQPWIKRILNRKNATLLVKPQVEVYRGEKSVKLIVEDIKKAD